MNLMAESSNHFPLTAFLLQISKLMSSGSYRPVDETSKTLEVPETIVDSMVVAPLFLDHKPN